MANIQTLSKDKRARLAAFLGSLPEETAARLFAALEADRARGGKGLPHDALLDDLRGKLIARDAAFPVRPPSAQRLFFTPFEDFLIAGRSGKKRRARIVRASIAPIWMMLTTDPACEGAARAAEGLNRALAEKSQSLPVFEARMFSEAKAGFDRLLGHSSDRAFRADLSFRLGGEGALEDLEEIRMLIDAVPHLKALQAAFRRPVATLTEEDLYELRRLYAAARADKPETAPYLLLALTGRMGAPWRALAAAHHLARAGEDEGAAVVVEILFDELESAARGLSREAETDLDAGDASFRVRHFADFADGLGAEARRLGETVVLNRIAACRDVAGESLIRFCEQSLAALRRAMPTRHAGGSSRLMSLRPDYQRALPPKVASAAREAAAFLASAEESARRLGKSEQTRPVTSDAALEVERYAGDLVAEIRAAEAEDRTMAKRLMEHVLFVAEPLLTEASIDLLRQRALAAALTA